MTHTHKLQKLCSATLRWGIPPTRGRIRDTSNSRKMHSGDGFASLLKVTMESYSTESCSKGSECRRVLIAKTGGLPAFFLFTCLATIQ